MKRVLLIFSLLLLIILGAAYFFIPTQQTFIYGINVNCTEDGANRYVIQKDKWQRWLPGDKKEDQFYSYRNIQYRFDKILLNGIEATVIHGDDSTKGFLQFLYYSIDSTKLQWTSAITLSANPFKRVVEYMQKQKLKNTIELFVNEIGNYFNQPENIYGFKVEKLKQVETSMVSVKQTFDHYPTLKETYSMIQLLKDYIHAKGVEEKDFPMLHVYEESTTAYEVMAAIPVKTEIPSEGKFQLKRMMMGSILMAEVRGGVASVTIAEQEFTNYVKDYKKSSPAIPFQSLVTNRLLETDTSKWVTRLYYPVFY